MLMRDEWFGHRDPITGAPLGDRDEWIDWDFALAAADQTIEAFTDDNGIPEWTKKDPKASIEAKRKIDQFKASIESITGSAKYKPTPGEYFVPDIRSLRVDKTLWTYQDWVNSEKEGLVE